MFRLSDHMLIVSSTRPMEQLFGHQLDLISKAILLKIELADGRHKSRLDPSLRPLPAAPLSSPESSLGTLTPPLYLSTLTSCLSQSFHPPFSTLLSRLAPTPHLADLKCSLLTLSPSCPLQIISLFALTSPPCSPSLHCCLFPLVPLSPPPHSYPPCAPPLISLHPYPLLSLLRLPPPPPSSLPPAVRADRITWRYLTTYHGYPSMRRATGPKDDTR